MIECINYNEHVRCYIFNEPFEPYYNLLNEAATDPTNKLQKNYNSCFLHRCLFVTLFTYRDNDPFFMYGLQQEPWMGNAARGFYRAYSKQVFRTVKNPKYDKHFFYKNSQLDIMGFYKSHPQFHRSYGIDTIFMTRNYNPNTKDSFESVLQRWGMSYYVPQPIPRIFHEVPQKFFVWGDAKFLSALEPYQPLHANNKPVGNV